MSRVYPEYKEGRIVGYYAMEVPGVTGDPIAEDSSEILAFMRQDPNSATGIERAIELGDLTAARIRKKEEIKSHAQFRILSVMKSHQQMNAVAKGVLVAMGWIGQLITRKGVNSGPVTFEDLPDLTSEDIALFSRMNDLFTTKILPIRQASDLKEEEVDALNTVEDVMSHDAMAGWPTLEELPR